MWQSHYTATALIVLSPEGFLLLNYTGKSVLALKSMYLLVNLYKDYCHYNYHNAH